MKKLSTFAILALLLLAAPAAALAAQPVTVVLDGERLNFDVPPVLENGLVLVPMRTIFEALGASVGWDGATSTVTAGKGSTTISLAIGQRTARKNGATLELDVPDRIVQGRTMVPVRFVAEALGADVAWLPAGRTVTIDLLPSSGSAGLEIQSVETIDFLQPAGWNVNRPFGLPANAKQKSLATALDRLAQALNQAQLLPSARPQGESRRVRLQVDGSWQDREGHTIYGGFLTLDISGRYARLEWPERFPGGLDL